MAILMAKSAKPKRKRKPSTRKAKPPARIVATGAIATTLRQNLLTLAHECVRLTGESLARVSRRINTDHKFFAKLEANECSFTVRKYDEMIAEFCAQWPEGASMPLLVDPTHSGDQIVRLKSQPTRTKDSTHGTSAKKAR